MICLVKWSEHLVCNIVLVWIIQYPLGVSLSNPIVIPIKTYWKVLYCWERTPLKWIL